MTAERSPLTPLADVGNLIEIVLGVVDDDAGALIRGIVSRYNDAIDELVKLSRDGLKLAEQAARTGAPPVTIHGDLSVMQAPPRPVGGSVLRVTKKDAKGRAVELVEERDGELVVKTIERADDGRVIAISTTPAE